MLAALGGAVGLALAAWGTEALLRIDPTALPRTGQIGMDAGVLLFTGGVTVITALLFGLARALQAGRAPAHSLGGERASTASGGRRRFRHHLVAAEVGLSVVVVLAAGLIVRSFQELTEVDPGVRVEGMLTFEVSLFSARFQDDVEVVQLFDELQSRLAALPGVRSASATSRLPLSGNTGRSDFRIEGRVVPSDGARMWHAEWSAVLPGYFETAEIFFPGEDPLGQRLSLPSNDPVWARIVGVVEGTRTASLDGELWPQVYLPHAQAPTVFYFTPRLMGFTVHTELDPDRLVGGVRAAVAELDPNVPVSGVKTMEEAFDDVVAQPRLLTNLLGSFAVIALLLAAVGIYGVVSYSVARRTREMGIRMALGAEGRQLCRLMVMEGTWPALVGVLVGVPVALALVSSWLPARRATRMAPTSALREE